MTDLSFLRVEALWALAGIALVVLLLRLLWYRRRRFVAFSAVGALALLRHRPSPIRRLPGLLVLGAIVLIVIALMEPVVPRSEGQMQSQGLDIVLVLDLSSSMQELMDAQRPGMNMAALTFSSRDGAPRRLPGRTRLETTKDALRRFIAGRRDDRIALIVFSDHAYVVSPLTFDHDYLRNYVDMVDDQILRGEGMTAIGEGIGLANFLLSKQSTSDRRNRVIIVFTDGEHNFGRDPIEALKDSDAAQIRVHVVGVDIEEEVKDKPAVRQLINTVRRHGGRYYDADTAAQLAAASADLNALEKGLLTHKVYMRNLPVFEWFAAPAAVLLLLALALRTVPFFAEFT